MSPLQIFLDDELRAARLWTGGILSSLARSVAQAGVAPAGVSGLEVQRALLNGERQVQDQWLQALRRLADNATGGAGGRAAADADLTIGLALVDDDQAQEDIEVMRAAQLVEHSAEWSIRELRALGAALQGDAEIRPESNPLRPELIARALREGVQTLPLTRQARVLLLHLAGPLLASTLPQVYAAAIERLESRGVVPMAYRTARLTPSLTSRTALPQPSFDISRPGAFDELMARLPGSSPRAGGPSPRAGPAGGGSSSGSTGGGGLAAALARQSRSPVETLIDEYIAAGDTRAMPMTQTPTALLRERFAALNAAAATDAERNVLNLMTRLFERMLADKRLHPPVRGTLGRLQLSALRIALSDPEMLDNPLHATWRLLNGIATQAIGYEDAGDARLHEWLAAANAALDDVAAASSAAHHHAQAWRGLEGMARAMLEAEQSRSADVISRLESLVRRDQLRVRHRERIDRQLQDTVLSTELRQFLLVSWADVLTSCVMRFGEDSRQTLALQAVVPGLLRSLQPMLPGTDAPARERDNERLGQWIAKGLQLIGWPDTHQQNLLARVASLQASAANPNRDPATMSAHELVRRLREDSDEDASAPRDAGPASVIDLGNLDTLPAPLAAETTPATSIAWLRLLLPGLWCQGFVRARWRSLQLVWVSADGGYLLFNGSPAGRHFSLTRPALERLAKEGLFKPLEPRNTLERAIDLLLADDTRPRPPGAPSHAASSPRRPGPSG